MLANLLDRFLWLYWRANRRFLSAYAEALIGEGEGGMAPDGPRIVARVEQYLREMPRPVFRQAVGALWLLPVSVPRRVPYSRYQRLLLRIFYILTTHTARVRFLVRSRAQRAQHLDRTFQLLADHAAAAEDDLLKPIVVLRSIKGIISGAYLELEPTWEALGYTPYPDRSWDPPSGPDVRHPPRLETSDLLLSSSRTPAQVARKPDGVTTYCVIGSGAGGGTAAYHIQRQDPGARVLLLEAGRMVPNDEFPVHLMDAVSRLYMNGGMTLSENQKYTFRQGRCVGGGTTVNNSVALRPTGFWWQDNLVDRWKSIGADLDWDELSQHYDEIDELLGVAPVDQRVITPMAETLKRGFEDVLGDGEVKTVDCNLKDCVGCGRCNLGCQYGAKMSMQETTIPAFVRDGGILVPETKATRLVLDGPRGAQHAVGVQVSGPGGSVMIEADKVVLAAGAYASTKLLARSGHTGSRPGVRTVGKRFSGNFGTPVVGRFKEPQDGWDGQQVAYVAEVPKERLVIETGFAPPPALGWMAPQWGNAFLDVVSSYDHLAVAVPVFGSIAYGDIHSGPLPSGYTIDFRLIEEDWRRLAVGMKLSGEALIAAGADEVFTTRFDGQVLRAEESLDDYFAGVGPLQYLNVETAHLQGGNVIHHDPNQGVVDLDLKVHGIDNTWIADASVIPAPITLNIQLTVMALASYAARRVAAA